MENGSNSDGKVRIQVVGIFIFFMKLVLYIYYIKVFALPVNDYNGCIILKSIFIIYNSVVPSRTQTHTAHINGKPIISVVYLCCFNVCYQTTIY